MLELLYMLAACSEPAETSHKTKTYAYILVWVQKGM